MNGWTRENPILGEPIYTHTHGEALRIGLGRLIPGLADLLGKRKDSAPKDELAEFAGIPAGHKEPPEDPVLARLLPDFEKAGDEEYEGDNSLLRSIHEADIIDAKMANLKTVYYSLDGDDPTITISHSQAQAWLNVLTDLRIYLLTGNQDDVTVVADFFGWVLEGLLEVMMEDME